MSVGLRLRNARIKRGLTQKDLAQLSGVKQSTISEVETGESKSPSGTNLVHLAHALRIRPEWLVTGKEPMIAGGVSNVIPLEAELLAINWLKLAPEVRSKVADMIEEMVKNSRADSEAVPDSRIENTYGKPPSRRKPVR